MKFNLMTVGALFTCCTLSSMSMANELDLRISDDTVHGAVSVAPDNSDIMFGIGYLYKDDDTSINILNIDLHAKGETALGNLPTTVGVGIQANAFKEEDFKGSGIGLGGSIRLNLPDAPGVSIEGQAHYAPSVMSFSDAEDFFRTRLQLNYRIIKSADISVGYRLLQADTEANRKRTFESGGFLGIKLKF